MMIWMSSPKIPTKVEKSGWMCMYVFEVRTEQELEVGYKKLPGMTLLLVIWNKQKKKKMN